MKPILCYFPSPPQGWEGIPIKATWVKQRLSQALQQGLTPTPMASVGLERLPVALDASTYTLVGDMARDMALAPGRVVGMLIQATIELQHQFASQDTAKRPADNKPGLQIIDNEHQRLALQALLPKLDQGRIALQEMGTGSGKSRLAGRIAQHLTQIQLNSPQHPDAPKPRVIIATPTIDQCIHLCKEIMTLRQAIEEQQAISPADAPPAAASFEPPMLLIGRTHFIDLQAAQEIALDVSQQCGNDALVQWLNNGAPAGLTRATQAISALIPGICGLMSDWLTLVQQVDPQGLYEDLLECELTEESSQDSARWYQELRQRSLGQSIVVCTHAMLAIDTIASKRDTNGPLGQYTALILDEAHQFEQEMANMASQGLSLLSLSQTLKQKQWSKIASKDAAQKALLATQQANTALGLIPMKSGDAIIVPDALIESLTLASAWANTLPALQNLQECLNTLSKSLRAAKDTTGWARARIQINSARRAIEFALAGTHSTHVSLSKVKRLATIQVGPRTVSHYLKHLWDKVQCAALLSATIYLPTMQGDSAAHIRHKLSLPADRVSELPSITPAWLTQNVQLHLPTGTQSLRRLQPPSSDQSTHEEMVHWLEQVAYVIAHQVAPTAKGSVMVLMSGYDRLDYLSDFLAPILGERLIVQARTGQGLSRAVEAMRQAHAKGIKSVLLCTGGAWTGLDIKDTSVADEDAALDFLLTDLVLPNLPFGMNRSTTHASRTSRGFFAEACETALLLRQGIGRLIRRANLLHRRIWILDSRLLVAPNGGRPSAIFAQCLLMLEKYKSLIRFTLPQQA